MNDFLIELQARLDEAKSKGNINSDISKIQNQIDKLKVQAEIEPKALSNLVKQLENVLNQKINISNINIDTSNAQKTGQKIGQTVADSAQKAIDGKNINVDKLNADVKTLTNNLNNFSSKNEGFNAFKTEINGVEVSLDSLISKLSTVDNETDLSTIRSQAAALKSAFTELQKINQIQLLSNGRIKNDYATQIAKLEGNFRSLGLSEDEVNKKTASVVTAFDTLKTRVNQPFDKSNYQEIITLNDNLQKELIESSNEYTKLQSSAKGFVSVQQRLSTANTIEAWNQKNTAATKEVIAANEAYVASLRDLNSQMTNMQFNKITTGFKQSENSMRALNKLGKAFKDQWSQAITSFSTWLSASTVVMKVVSETKEAIVELKDIDTILTEISKTSELTKQQLKELGNTSFETSSKYGKKSSDYLVGIQEMYRAGYANAEQLAELSTLAQSAGDLDAELANDYIIASDAAYGYAGNIEKLNELLDSQNQVTNRNAVSMEELARATKVAANQLSNSNIDENEMTALLGTGIATSREAGETVGRAVKGIIMNLQQVKGETGFDGEIIDEDSLAKVEARCHSVGVELEYMQDGIARLRDPMEVLKELAEVYNSLPDDSADKAGIISDIGGKYRGNVLSSILSNWDKYEKMLQDYENASGSAMEEAMKSANNWEGSLNRLSNTWTDTIGNIANSDAIITIINSLNSLLSVVNKVTDALGSLGSIGLGAGLFAGIKNVGKLEKLSFIFCFEYADNNMCSLGY